jgi:type IV pilus assembly protein PilC
MKTFLYTVKNKENKILKGILEADSKEQLIDYFHRENCLVISLKESKKKLKLRKRGKVKIDDLVIFSRQFTTLIDSGIPVVEALEILKEQVERAYLKEVLGMVVKDVKEGAFLSKALAKHATVFPEIYISMVEAAEISGNLPEILNRVSLYLEKSSALRKKIISALYYPVVIVVMAIGITGFLVFKIIPTFKEIFSVLGGSLPLPTQILVSISEALRRKALLIGAILGGCFLFLTRVINTPKGKLYYHKLLLRLPVFGNLIKKIAIAKFSRTFSTLVRSGVSIVKGLEIVAKTSGNRIVEDAVMQSRKFIQEGEPISTPLEKTGIFPPMVTKMISVGERSGRLEEMLSKIAQFYEEQTDALISGLASLIEPIIIVFLGVVIGGIVVALFLPIIKITQYLGVK